MTNQELRNWWNNLSNEIRKVINIYAGLAKNHNDNGPLYSDEELKDRYDIYQKSCDHIDKMVDSLTKK